jgi:pimeloyl-ACP methyl ester carboxylesterase
MLNHSLYDVHFADVVQYSDQATDDAIRDYFKIYDVEPRKRAFEYTLAFDLDGNGRSERFYRLLNSRSLPVKQTVFRECHDERLQPWQHYVPVSPGMEHLPEVVQAGRDVVVITHSYGCIPGLAALAGLDSATRQASGQDNGVKAVAMIAGFLCPPGNTMLAMMGGRLLPQYLYEGDTTLPFNGPGAVVTQG